MAQGLYQHLKSAWKNQNPTELRERMTQWRSSNATVKLDKPTRLDKARMLGYKAKKGFIVVRVRLARGGRKRERPSKGRKSRRMSVMKILKMNYRWVAEIRAQNAFPNLEVLNSYYLAKDGQHYFFEVILIDPERPEIQNDPVMNWISDRKNQGRVYRGLTSAGKKSRGLRSKSPMNPNRPSVRAGKRRGK
ncbi:MAG: hypothetical protein RL557_103 [archaeon]|jgi:large subunit ribosomal protein L15e